LVKTKSINANPRSTFVVHKEELSEMYIVQVPYQLDMLICERENTTSAMMDRKIQLAPWSLIAQCFDRDLDKRLNEESLSELQSAKNPHPHRHPSSIGMFSSELGAPTNFAKQKKTASAHAQCWDLLGVFQARFQFLEVIYGGRGIAE